MCGIAGVVSIGGRLPIDMPERLAVALDEIGYRGPDAVGMHITKQYAVGHVRLSVLDLTETGNQPMFNERGTACIVYNGAVYNYLELGASLGSGTRYVTRTDTEVILDVIDREKERAFPSFNGMYAFCYIDEETGKAYLVRDKYGIKPLHYFISEGCLYFASAISALLALVDRKPGIRRSKILEYLYFGACLGPESVLEGIKEVEPGSFLSVDINGGKLAEEWYSVSRFSALETKPIIDTDAQSITGLLRKTLVSAVERQLRSDVPVALFLSGGVDSSVLAWSAAVALGEKIDTFCARFDFSSDDEHVIAKQTAKQFGTNHNEIEITAGDVPAAMMHLASVHSNPLGDYADIPLYLMSHALKGRAKVVLQGDGGDELFGGYRRYRTLAALDRVSGAHDVFAPLLGALSKLLPSRYHRQKRYLAALSSCDWRLYARLMTTESCFRDPVELVRDLVYEGDSLGVAAQRYLEVFSRLKYSSRLEMMLSLDRKIALPDLFLRKVDAATMAASVEARVPFLDDHVVSLADQLPVTMKVAPGDTKIVLKEAFRGLIPTKVISGSKKGLTVPVAEWLRTSMKDFFWDEVTSGSTYEYLNIGALEKLYRRHCSGVADHGQILWRVLCFALWLKVNNRRGVG